jgi:nucleoside-diphosphate-sugar epimerase
MFEDREFPLYEGSEHHLRSYTYVDDIIDGFVAVLDNLDGCHGEILNIGTDSTLTTGEGIAIVEQIMGKSARIVRVPKRAGDQLRTEANIEKARAMLGYDPTTTPMDGLAAQVAWYRDIVSAAQAQ